jgi:outer membrane protein assembly factor BamB
MRLVFMRVFRLVLPLATIVSVGVMLASDWPGWRGADRSGLSPETHLLKAWPDGGPKLTWSAKGLGVGFSSVSISGNRIYTMGDRGESQYVYALNLADGAIVWSTKIGPAWDDDYGGPRGTPAVDGDSVYAIGTEGEVVCLKASDGSLKWERSMTRDFGGQMMSQWKFAESPLVDGDKVLFTPGSFGATMVAVDKRTGKDIWRAGTSRGQTQGSNGAGYSSIVVSEGAGVKQYVQLTGRGLIGVRASDGKTLWTYNRIANDVANISTPVVRGDYVFGATGYQTGAALLKLSKTADGVEAKEVYFLDPKVFQNHHGGFLLVGDFLYAGHGHNNGFPICIEFLTGKIRWGGNQRVEGATGSAAVAYADGHLYFRYQNGAMKLFEASPEGFKETGSFKIPAVRNPSWSHPVISGGKLYLREQDTLLAYNVHE